MAYIYKITNDINDKVYIGKTYSSIEKRWRQHRKDYKKERFENRPLYSAMNKHGIEHFYIEMIEETDDPANREIFWIDYYDAYYSGYNGTRGGDGKLRLKHEKIIETYKKVQSVKETAKICSASADQVSNILKANNIPIKSSSQIMKETFGKPVKMKDIDSGEIKMVFDSNRDAARYLKASNPSIVATIQSVASAIACTCTGKKENAYGFLWEH